MNAIAKADTCRDDIAEILNACDFPAEPDAERQECGFQVALTYVPSLANPTLAVVEVTVENGTILLDSLDVLALDGFDVYRHTALYSEALRTFLDRRPAPTPEVDGEDEEVDPFDLPDTPDEDEIPF
jgi:hypothetical protein